MADSSAPLRSRAASAGRTPVTRAQKTLREQTDELQQFLGATDILWRGAT